MKKKFLVLTLCFTLIFSNLNYKKSYADGGIISLPMLATVSALAVGTGIAINNSDDLYDLGRMFYDYVDRHNDLTWATVQSVFSSSVALQPNKLVSVDSEFLDIVKGFFEDIFTSDYICTTYFEGIKVYSTNKTFSLLPTYGTSYSISSSEPTYLSENLYLTYDGRFMDLFLNDVKISSTLVYSSTKGKYIFTKKDNGEIWFTIEADNGYSGSNVLDISASFDFPYNGGYTWDNVDNRKENDSVSLPIPNNLGQLVGQSSKDFWDNTDNLVGNGNLSLPNVDNPSISLDGTTSFPNTGVDTDTGAGNPSVPNTGIWATIKDFIISLVVPSDTFWTDTWGGLYNNFTSSFPMVDMDGFNDLVTGEKKFPNIDINIMGVSGRVVNGDVVNSIVDWLRPIIAGFMMLCLMLFNYRKIYKLIRNSEPFGSVASGNNSDIRTGISEYSKHEVVKATDMVAEYQAWKERGGK